VGQAHKKNTNEKNAMSENAKVNKSEAIRIAIAENPEDSNGKIVTLLAAKGINVSENYVSKIRNDKPAKEKLSGIELNKKFRQEIIPAAKTVAEVCGSLKDAEMLFDHFKRVLDFYVEQHDGSYDDAVDFVLEEFGQQETKAA
jgi:hypothetical protein